MSNETVTRRRFTQIGCTVLLAISTSPLAMAQQPPANPPGPQVKVTEVPPAGGGKDRTDAIAGTVSGVKAKDCQIVIFSKTDQWYVQPLVDTPFTDIDDEGKWDADIHLGAEYAVFLIKRGAGYKPPATTKRLPKVEGAVLAMALVKAKKAE